jgi:hypothetical protein
MLHVLILCSVCSLFVVRCSLGLKHNEDEERQLSFFPWLLIKKPEIKLRFVHEAGSPIIQHRRLLIPELQCICIVLAWYRADGGV